MRFSVLSYNVLHSFGASRLFKARGAGASGPAWARDRLSHAAELVRRLEPDVACLQELDEAGQAAVQAALGEDFECAVAVRNEELPARDGCAAFVRKSRFQVAGVHHFRLRDSLARHFPEDARSEAKGMAAALWRELQEKLNLAVAVRLSGHGAAAGAGELCVATTHLFWDPRYPDLKLLQAFLLAKELERFTEGSPLVLAGDLNSTPFAEADGEAIDLSGVYGLLTRGRVPVNHPHHPVLLRRTRGILQGVSPADVPELEVQPFRSAYFEAQGLEGPITNAARDFRGCLDYILYQPGGGSAAAGVARPAAGGAAGPRLRLLGVKPLPTEEELSPHTPLPSAAHPSDHLPLWAEFELAAA